MYTYILYPLMLFWRKYMNIYVVDDNIGYGTTGFEESK